MNTLQERNELTDDALHKLRQLGQQWNDRLTLNNLRLIDRYLKGELEILIHLRWRAIGPRYSRHLCVAVKCYRDQVGWSDGRDFGISLPHVSVDGSPRDGVERIQEVVVCKAVTKTLDSVSHNEQDSVFIGIVKFSDDPKRLIPSLVRLDSLDAIYGSRVNSLRLSLGSFFEFVRVIEEREGRPIYGLTGRMSLNQSASEMIEGTPKAVDSISGNQRELDREIFAKAKAALSGIRVLIAQEQVWVSFSKGTNPGFEITNVVLGPFDFRPNAD